MYKTIVRVGLGAAMIFCGFSDMFALTICFSAFLLADMLA